MLTLACDLGLVLTESDVMGHSSSKLTLLNLTVDAVAYYLKS